MALEFGTGYRCFGTFNETKEVLWKLVEAPEPLQEALKTVKGNYFI